MIKLFSTTALAAIVVAATTSLALAQYPITGNGADTSGPPNQPAYTAAPGYPPPQQPPSAAAQGYSATTPSYSASKEPTYGATSAEQPGPMPQNYGSSTQPGGMPQPGYGEPMQSSGNGAQSSAANVNYNGTYRGNPCGWGKVCGQP